MKDFLITLFYIWMIAVLPLYLIILSMKAIFRLLDRSNSSQKRQLMHTHEPYNLNALPFELTGLLAKQPTIVEAYQKLSLIPLLITQIEDDNIKSKLQSIGTIATRIFEDLRNQPDDIPTARRFLPYLMNTTVEVSEKYIRLINSQIESKDADSYITKISETLDRVETALEAVVTRLLDNDLIELEAEINLLNNVLKSEGLD